MEIHKLHDENGNVIHACATGSFPLPQDHWIYDEAVKPEPAGGFDSLEDLRVKARDAMKYTLQMCTRHGKDGDIDPDAVCQTMERTLFGNYYRTPAPETGNE